MASDDGFREIHLSGKHLVALFMATTGVAVVVFLCGVMVGRGVRGTLVAGSASVAVPPAADLNAVPDSRPQSKAAVAPPIAPPPDDVGSEAPPETGSPAQPPVKTGPAAVGAASAASKAAPAVPPAAQAAPKPGPAAPAQKAAVPTSAPTAFPTATIVGAVPAEPPGTGIPVQVGAYAERSQAETVARGLLAKGYTAYIVPPPAAGGMFRVRVGKFKERREAEAVLRRLVKEEHLSPWIPPR